MSTKNRPPQGTEWLKEFGYVPQEDFAAMLGITVKSLKLRPRAELPDFAKVGHRWLFKADSVREYLERHVQRNAA
jgi:hypothetical protein